MGTNKADSNFRKEFPLLETLVYLNHAATSLLPNSTKFYLYRYLDSITTEAPNYERDKNLIEQARMSLAKFLNCNPSEIAFVENTSSGISKIAQGLRLGTKDKIACLVPDFPSNIYPWLWQEKKGIEVYFIQYDHRNFRLKDIVDKIKPNTKLFALSHVNYVTGFCLPLVEISSMLNKKGIWMFVDMIQSIGAIPVDLKALKVHFMAAGSHKWMMGLPGAGILYISKEVQGFVEPLELGWKSVKHEEDFSKITLDLKEDALVMEPGTMNVVGILALSKGIELINSYGIQNAFEAITSWNASIAKELKRANICVASPYGNEYASGILTFMHDKPRLLYNYLTEQNIKTSLRENMIRISPHFYNDEQDLKNLMDAILRYEKLL